MPARSADHIRIEAYCGSRDRLRSLFELAEDSAAGVFAVGDVRHGSVKRVASAVGEGSVAIRLVHDYLALPGHVPQRESCPPAGARSAASGFGETFRVVAGHNRHGTANTACGGPGFDGRLVAVTVWR